MLSGIFDTRQCPNFNVSEYWLNSLLSARLAREFAQSIPEIDADEAYLCAMLYEIGQMALAFLYPEAMNQILTEDEAIRLSRETETFGSNHYGVSAALLDQWHLPETVVHVLNESSVTEGMELSKITQLIRLCKQLSSELLASPIPSELQQEQSSYSLPDFLQPLKTELESAVKKTAAKLSDFKEMAQLLS